MALKILIPIAAVIVALFVIAQTLFTIDETSQGIVTQVGVYIRTVKEPGLHFKVPFYQTVTRYDKRVLVSDAPSTEYLTLDKKRLVVDSYTRWFIADPLTFFKTVRTEAGALARLDGIVLSELRRELSAHDFKDIIGSERESIMERVATRSRPPVAEFGITVVDVRIKRADLPREVQQSVFDRMKAERDRIAKRYRAEGEERARSVRAEADKTVTIIAADADRQSKSLRGKGDAEAITIFAKALERDPEFYAFLRSLEAYETILKQKTTLVLSTDSELFRYLQNQGVTP